MPTRTPVPMENETLNASVSSVIDAGMTFQREFARSAAEAVRTGMSVTRAGVHLARENVDKLPEVMRMPAEAASRTLGALATSVPGVDPREAARTMNEISDSFEAWQSVWMKSVDVWRASTSEVLARYEDVLLQATKQSDEGMRAWIESADASGAVARDVATQFAQAMVSGVSAETGPRTGQDPGR